jgi:hypothetical protein
MTSCEKVQLLFVTVHNPDEPLIFGVTNCVKNDKNKDHEFKNQH